MRSHRIIKSTQSLDTAEKQWWNDNALTIEKIWAQNIYFQKAIRLPYLKKMKQFFLKNNNNDVFTILEIGCGSGWVGRLVADKNFHIIGTDFSSSQLDLAARNAKNVHKDEYCKYQLADASTFKKNIDGVLIHALLHHLSAEELDSFFNQLANLASGTKVFIYEPVFFERRKSKPSLYDKVMNKLIYSLKSLAHKRAQTLGIRDNELTEAMNKINKEAEKNGWYISPKEIPFFEGELEKYCHQLFKLHKKYIVNKTDLDIAQALAYNSIENPPLLFSMIFFPMARLLDRLSFLGNFTQFVYPNQHLFVCFELQRK